MSRTAWWIVGGIAVVGIGVLLYLALRPSGPAPGAGGSSPAGGGIAGLIAGIGSGLTGIGTAIGAHVDAEQARAREAAAAAEGDS